MIYKVVSVNKNVKFKTSLLRSYVCDYNDVHIVVKESIGVTNTNDGNEEIWSNETLAQNKKQVSTIIAQI